MAGPVDLASLVGVKPVARLLWHLIELVQETSLAARVRLFDLIVSGGRPVLLNVHNSLIWGHIAVLVVRKLEIVGAGGALLHSGAW